jgi:hypothetical protein
MYPLSTVAGEASLISLSQTKHDCQNSSFKWNAPSIHVVVVVVVVTDGC